MCWDWVLWSHHENCSKKVGSTVIHSQRFNWKNNSVIFQQVKYSSIPKSDKRILTSPVTAL